MTARGTTSERWGDQWPQGTTVQSGAALEDPIGLGDPFGTARLDPAAAEPTGVPEFTETDGAISIEAEHSPGTRLAAAPNGR